MHRYRKICFIQLRGSLLILKIEQLALHSCYDHIIAFRDDKAVTFIRCMYCVLIGQDHHTNPYVRVV
jgi:hypothetical protein